MGINHMTWRLTIILILAIHCDLSAQSFNGGDFIKYTTREGLSNNWVTGIAQDAYGYLWISTNKGLNRFDGNSFHHFLSDSTDRSLPTDFIFKMKWLDGENLGLMCSNGLHVVNTRTLEESNILIPQASQFQPMLNRVSDFCTDKEGNLFLSTITGFYELDKNRQLVFRYDYALLPGHKGSFGWTMTMTSENTIILSTFPHEFYVYKKDSKDFHLLGKNDDPFYKGLNETPGLFARINDKMEDWRELVASEKGIKIFNLRTKIAKPVVGAFDIFQVFNGGGNSTGLAIDDSTILINAVEHGIYAIHFTASDDSYTISPNELLPDYSISSFLKDSQGRLWIGTNKGLFYLKKPSAEVKQLELQPQNMDNTILSLAVANGRVFAGTTRSGISVIDAKKMVETNRVNLSGYKVTEIPNMIFCMISASRDTLLTGIAGAWVHTSTLSTGAFDLKKIDTAFNGVELIFKSSKGTIYMRAAEKNLFYVVHPNGATEKMDYREQLSKLNRITSMAEDKDGNIWFAGSILARLNIQSNQFDLMLDSFPKSKVTAKMVSSNLVFDSTGRLYFGLWERGLLIYDPVQRSFQRFTRQEGLPDNVIRSLSLHGNKLWMATDNGLAVMDLDTHKIFSFGAAYGIPGDPANVNLLQYNEETGQMFGALRNVVYRFNPDSLHYGHAPPQFNIENIIIDGKKTIWHPSGEIRVRYDQNNLLLNLASVNFEDAFQQNYAYRITENGNEPWIETGAQHSIIFSSLPPGTHRVQVKVFARDGSWPDQVREIIIVIRPPFWKTTWFFVLLLAAIVVILSILHRRRITRIREQANLDKLVAQSEMKALHSQMNPHFIFNCLNSIREMILERNEKQASHYLSKFAQLIRITLNNSTRAFVSLSSAIDYLERYLEMEKIRTDQFSYSFHVDRSLDPTSLFLPPMLIQPFLENAIWHGRVPGRPMQLKILFERSAQQLVCTVDDDGLGIDASIANNALLNKGSMGIDNIRKRIRLLNEKYGMDASLTVVDKSTTGTGQGTLVTLRLPLKYSET